MDVVAERRLNPPGAGMVDRVGRLITGGPAGRQIQGACAATRASIGVSRPRRAGAATLDRARRGLTVVRSTGDRGRMRALLLVVLAVPLAAAAETDFTTHGPFPVGVTTIELTPEGGIDEFEPDYDYIRELIQSTLHPPSPSPEG